VEGAEGISDGYADRESPVRPKVLIFTDPGFNTGMHLIEFFIIFPDYSF
jgi:hypothetical protein